MKTLLRSAAMLGMCSSFLFLGACATTSTEGTQRMASTTNSPERFNKDYASVMPSQIDTGGVKTVIVDPNVHAWGAYAEDGHLVRAGIATAGSSVCPPDAKNTPSCMTGVGTFRITGMGDGSCYSKKYDNGLMPYCMYFNNGEALHGSPDSIVVSANISHGCVRMRIPDAEWMRYNFAQVGTKVIVRPYSQ